MKKRKAQKQVTTNELLQKMDEGFRLTRVTTDELLRQMNEGFKQIREEFSQLLSREIKSVRVDMTKQFSSARSEMKADRESLSSFRSEVDMRFRQSMLYMMGEFDEVNDRLDTMLPRAEFLEWVHKYDGSLKEIREARQNRLLFENQFVDLDDKVAKHENRIKKLEQKAG